MKKVFLGVAAVAMLGLAACSNKANTTEDTASVDSVEVAVVEDTVVAVDSANDTAVVATEEVAAVETPAQK